MTNRSKAKNSDGLEHYLTMLIEMRVRHTLKSCSSSSTIHIEEGRKHFFPNGEPIDSKHLNFIKRVKKEVCRNAIKLNLVEQSPKFIRFSPLFAESFTHYDFVEIDKRNAYWYTALDFGLICQATYNAGLLAPKRVRLMALGSAATTKDVSYFDGERYTHLPLEYDKHGRLAFFAVAKRVDEIMSHALDLLHGNAAFYWVDALFVRANFADYAADMIRGFGYEVTVTPLLWMKVDAMEKKVTGCRILDERTLKNGHKIQCLEFKTYYKPRKNKQP